MKNNIDKLSIKEISANIDAIYDADIEVFDEIGSTNDYLKEKAKKGDFSLSVAIADRQTSGKGRIGRKFYSPENCGIYMSFLLRPELLAEQSVNITAAAVVSVCETLEKFGVKDFGIKWVNDIFLDNKKVCGILTEGSINTETKAFDWIVLGIGINVYEPENGFDNEIADIAGYIFKKRKENLRNLICSEIINRIFYCCNRLNEKEYLDFYRKNSLVTGKKITVIKGEEKIPANAVEIDDNFRLIVEYTDGKKQALNSGEISIKLQ